MSETRKVQRWTGYVSAFDGGGFVAYGDYLLLKKQRDELAEALREVVRISDRKHDAWDKEKDILARLDGGKG